MPTYNLNNELQEVDTSLDSIAIISCLQDIPGGRTLDTTGFTGVIKAGHVVIKDSNSVYKPMPVSSGVYESLPSGNSYVGVLKGSILATKPSAAIMIEGTVNEEVAPYPYTSAMKNALNINFITD